MTLRGGSSKRLLGHCLFTVSMDGDMMASDYNLLTAKIIGFSGAVLTLSASRGIWFRETVKRYKMAKI